MQGIRRVLYGSFVLLAKPEQQQLLQIVHKSVDIHRICISEIHVLNGASLIVVDDDVHAERLDVSLAEVCHFHVERVQIYRIAGRINLRNNQPRTNFLSSDIQIPIRLVKPRNYGFQQQRQLNTNHQVIRVLNCRHQELNERCLSSSIIFCGSSHGFFLC